MKSVDLVTEVTDQELNGAVGARSGGLFTVPRYVDRGLLLHHLLRVLGLRLRQRVGMSSADLPNRCSGCASVHPEHLSRSNEG